VAEDLHLVNAEVPCAVFDEWRRIVVFPLGLTEVQRIRTLRELFAERRSGHSDNWRLETLTGLDTP